MKFLTKKKRGLFYFLKKRNKLQKLYDDNEEFILYCLVSIICTGVLYITFYLVDKITNGNYMLANLVSYITSFTLLYFLDERIFKAKPHNKKNRYNQMIIFIIVRIIGFPIDSYILYLLIKKCNMNSMIAKVVGSLIMFIYNYITNKILVFKIKE